MTSTIDPNVPATDADLLSAPIRDNFTAAYNDINGIETTLAGLGNMSTQSQNNVTITGGNIAGNGAGLTHITAANIDAGTAAINISGNAATVTTINGHVAQGSNVTISGTGTIASPYTISATGGTGTVTSVGLAADGFFVKASGSPITSSGTITLSDATHPALTIMGNPSGSIAAPTDIELSGTLVFSGSELHTAALTGDVTTSSNSFVTSIANNAVTTVKISDNAVTNAKMATATKNHLAGYDNSGNFSDVVVGKNLTLSGGTLSASGTGTPGGVHYDVQLNDGAGGFAGSNDLNFQGGYLTINGDSGYGQLQFLNTPVSSGYGGAGINGTAGEVIPGAAAGDLSIWASQSISFGGNTGNAIQLNIDGATGKINIPELTASELTATDASSNLQSLTTATYPSLTEISYVKGVTSAIQTQLNAKQATLTIGNLTDVGTDGITIGSGTGAVIGSGTTISQHVADTSHNGYLSSTDWNTFNSKGSGTVTAVSIASANGFSGSSSGGATPALTIVAGAIVPTSVNSVVISGASTPTLAVTGTTTVSGANTGDQTITLTGDVTGSGTGSFAATIGNNKVTYAKMQQATKVTLLGNPTGSTANLEEITLGTNLSFSGTTLNATGGGSTGFDAITSGTNTTAAMVVDTGASLAATGTGTIAATTVATINGQLANGTNTTVSGSGTSGSPYTVGVAIATSSVLGVVKPDGTIITDSAGAITVAKASASQFGVVEVDNTTITASGGVISAVNTGTVTSVTGTTNRITSSGGATPAIDISASYAGQTSLTTLGTIGTGTWQGTKIGDAYGGTNADSSASTGVAQVSSGTWSFSTALANGTTATTQASSDNSTKVATTAYVTTGITNALNGLDWKPAVGYATTANVIGTNVAGVFTYTSTGVDTIDGHQLALNDVVLFKNQTTGADNGVWVVTTAGAIGVAGILTRRSDYNTAAQIHDGDTFFVQNGTVNAATSWVQTAVVTTINVDPLAFSQVAGPGTYTAGTGLTLTGNSFSVNASQTQITAVGTIGTGIWQGTKVGLAYGGTNADLSATGGASNVLKQSSSGAAITVGALTASDVGLGNVTNDAQTKASIVPNTAPSAGQILVGNAGGTAYAPVSASGAFTLASTGAATIATPGTLTVSSSNSTATAHTHAITSSSAPGAAASILATDSSGIIGSTGTRIVKIWATDLTVTNAIAGSVTGNAGTATALQNARTIGGVSFDGTGNIVPQTIQSVNEATDTTCFPLFINDSGSVSDQPKNNTSFTFNSNTGALGATSFSGAGTGLTGTAASLTAGTVTTNANLTGVITSSGNATSTGAQTGTGNTFAMSASPTFTGTVTIAAQTNTGIMYLNGGVAEEAVFSNGNSGTSKAINLDNGNLQSITISGAVAITQTTPTHPGKYTLVVTQDNSGHVYSLSGIKFPGGTAPTYSTAANKIDVFSIVYDGTNYYGMGGIAFS